MRILQKVNVQIRSDHSNSMESNLQNALTFADLTFKIFIRITNCKFNF